MSRKLRFGTPQFHFVLKLLDDIDDSDDNTNEHNDDDEE